MGIAAFKTLLSPFNCFMYHSTLTSSAFFGDPLHVTLVDVCTKTKGKIKIQQIASEFLLR